MILIIWPQKNRTITIFQRTQMFSHPSTFMAFMVRIGNAMAAKMRAAKMSFQAGLCQNTAVWAGFSARRCSATATNIFFSSPRFSTREVDQIYKTFSVGVVLCFSGFLVQVLTPKATRLVTPTISKVTQCFRQALWVVEDW